MKNKSLLVCFVAASFVVGAASYQAGKRVTDRYYDAEPDVTCAGCHWQEVAASGACVKNCVESPAIWINGRPTCPEGSELAADQAAAIAGKDSARCVR